jgi:hypothetical protein
MSSSSDPVPGFHMSALRFLVITVAFFFAAVLLCFCLAFEWIPGYPESAEKSVALYYQPSPKPADPAVYLHPPLNFMQTDGQGQLLAFQFTNRGSSPIAVHTLELFSADCFFMEPKDPVVQRLPATMPFLTLDLNQSVVLWYRLLPLKDSRKCPGQSPLVFLYTWQQLPAGSPPPALLEQQSISTGPVRVTTQLGLHWERFFSLLGKIGPLILLPVLLAIGNYLLQELQQRKAEVQKLKDDEREADAKRQEQKLEVWKVMVPGMVQAIRDHYVPIVRVLSILKDQADRPADQADLNEILACSLLFRTKTTHMVDKNGGFYFHNLCGEELCATLANLLLGRFYELSGDLLAFRESAEKLQPVNSLPQTRRTLRIDAPLPGRFARLRTRFQQQLREPAILAQLRSHAVLLMTILEREINDPFLPFWYETEPSPLDGKKLEDSVAELKLSTEDEAEVRKQVKAYIASLDAKTKANSPGH